MTLCTYQLSSQKLKESREYSKENLSMKYFENKQKTVLHV
jgi:hypothetical protein